MVEMLKYCLLPVCAYLLGAIPFGLVFAKAFAGIDIRRQGSGNIGATNVRRLTGNGLGLATLIADVAKGALPVGLALQIAPADGTWRQIYPLVTLWAAFLGHLYPIFLRFRGGGKGVATAGGGLYALSASAGLLTTIAFLAIVTVTRRVSLGSLGAALLMPLTLWYTTQSHRTAMGLILVTIMIWLRHRDNIRRIITGIEPRLW